MTGEWAKTTVEKYQRIKREVAGLRQLTFDENGQRGWRLEFQGNPVALWIARGAVNTISVRVR